MATATTKKVKATRPLYEGGERYAKGQELKVTASRHKALGAAVSPPAVSPKKEE